MDGHLLTMVEFKLKKMNKIIAILFLFIAVQSCAQIDPYQIIKDSLGAHRILLTDSTGEYTRVLLRDAISDSIGVGKFVNGTDPLEAVYVDGNVGIGTIDPSSDLEISDLQTRIGLTSTKDGSWVSGSYMSEILFRSEDTSGASGASTRASIRTEAVDAGGSPITDGSDIQLVFKIKGDVAGLPPDAMILKSNKDLEVLGGIYAAERTGTANKSAFFDADGKLVEGDMVNLNVAYGGLESQFKTISSTSATKADFNLKWGEEINTTASTTSDRITVDSTAMYTILVRGDITNYTLDEEIKLVIKVNGVTVENHKTYCHNTTEFDINYTDDIEMSATDYIEIYLDSVTDTDYEYNDLKLTVKRAY